MRRSALGRAVSLGALVVGLLVVLRLARGMERLFFFPSKGPTPLAQAPPGAEAVRFASRDGTELSGWFVPAEGAADAAARRARPTVLHLHGNAGNMLDHAWFTAYLPSAGFNLFLFDYRGYGESEGSARSRDGLLDDARGALEHLLARPDVDPARIGLYGQSLGGALGLVLMAERPEIRAAVFESPFASWRDIAASAIGGEPPAAPARWLARLLIPDHARPLDAIRRIDRPILLLHGEADRVVPASHSRRLAAAAGPSARLVLLPGGEHNSLRDTHPEVEGLVVELLGRSLR
jgi:dipeptidyl aminopeptidase/acylaminoacyl peptidase